MVKVTVIDKRTCAVTSVENTIVNEYFMADAILYVRVEPKVGAGEVSAWDVSRGRLWGILEGTQVTPVNVVINIVGDLTDG